MASGGAFRKRVGFQGSVPELHIESGEDLPVGLARSSPGHRVLGLDKQVEDGLPFGDDLADAEPDEESAHQMKAARARGKHLGRPRTPTTVVAEVEELVRTTDPSVREIQRRIGAKTGRGVVGDIVKRVRHGQQDAALRFGR